MDYLVLDDMSVVLIEVNAFPNMNHNHPRKGGKVQPNEMAFRAGGFDRDLIRRLGLEMEPETAEEPNRWVDVTHPSAYAVK